MDLINKVTRSITYQPLYGDVIYIYTVYLNIILDTYLNVFLLCARDVMVI